MKYLKSTSSRAYTFDGKVIPPNTSSKWLTVDNSTIENWEKNVVYKSLVKSGNILVSDKEPTEMAQSTGGLLKSNAELRTEVANLKAQVAKLEEEAKGVVGENDSAELIKSLQDELAKAKEDYATLEKEAKESIAALKKQLKEAKKE